MVVKLKRVRVTLTLTEPFYDLLNVLVEKGLFMEKQSAIREALRDLFIKYDL